MALWAGGSLVLLLCVSGFCFFQQQKRVGATTTFTNEDVYQLKMLNRTAIKTILTKHGDIYDCVDFYEQPAFDHPLLKNHDFHPKSMTRESPKFGNLWQNGKGCPSGTIPIRKTTQEDLVNITLATQIFARKYDSLTDAAEIGTHYAVLHTTLGDIYHGARMEHNSWNPPVSGAQYSASFVKLANGRERIEVGWIVNPSLYGDNKTHSYIYTNMGTSHCFNLFCPGFVSTRPDIPVDQVLTTTILGKEPQHGQNIIIEWLSKESIWVLKIGNDDVPTAIGFWPEQIFTTFRDSATYVEWGGKVYSPIDVPSPPMGSGQVLEGLINGDHHAYCKRVVLVDKSFKVEAPKKATLYADIREYRVYRGGFEKPMGYTMFYGGLGGYRGK